MPDSKSRDQLGKQTLVSLKEYFNSAYGDEDSVTYQEVRMYHTLHGVVHVIMYLLRGYYDGGNSSFSVLIE